MKYRRIKRRFTKAGREKYRKARSQENRTNKNNKNERMLGKQFQLIQDCNGRKENITFYKQVNRTGEGSLSWHFSCRHIVK
jgi:hypothetical protein